MWEKTQKNVTTVLSLHFGEPDDVVCVHVFQEHLVDWAKTQKNHIVLRNKGKSIDKHTVSGNIMQRAIISTLAVDGVKVLREGALPGLFTVNEDGKKVCFSQGNLYYDGSKFCLET